MLGVEGFDTLVRTTADLDRLPSLFARGVRLFQPTYAATGALAGSSAAGDARGLTDLGRAFLVALAEIVGDAAGPRVILDLAHLNPVSAADVLAWFEADAERPRRLIPVYSHGAAGHPAVDSPRALAPEALRRLRALGGVVGLTPAFFEDADAFAAAIEAVAAVPFLGRAGYEGIAIGTDFLGVNRSPAGLGSAPEVAAWLSGRFAPPVAAALIHDNAAALLGRMAGATNGRREG